MNDAREFLNHLFTGLGGYCELTFIAPKQHNLFPAIFTESYKIGADKIDFKRIAEFNERGYGCYFGVTSKRNPPSPGKRATEDSALWLTALWAEVDLKAGDYATILDIHNALMVTFPQTPTTIVSSGGGLHAYWKVRPVLINRNNRDGIKRTLQGLAKAIKGDSVWDLARVMRLPGTINTKPERDNAVCKIVYRSDNRYSLGNFRHYAELATPKRKPASPADLPPQTIPGYLKWFLTSPHPDGQRNNRLNWTAHKMWGDGFSLIDAEQWLLSRALAIGLDERPSLATIRSPFKKG